MSEAPTENTIVAFSESAKHATGFYVTTFTDGTARLSFISTPLNGVPSTFSGAVVMNKDNALELANVILQLYGAAAAKPN